MNIGIDARLIGETGVGRYIRNLIAGLARIDSNNTYTVFLTKSHYGRFTVPGTNWNKVLADIKWHTVEEQRKMPGILSQQHLDVVHIPYHNPPIFYGGPMVITIHDVTILHFNTGKATTLPLPLYYLKRAGYWFELAVGLRKSSKILTVSQATKREIISHFRIPASKIRVTYEGVDPNLRVDLPSSKRTMKDPYFLYVGNAYPHKNLETLINAWKSFKETHVGTHRLVLVGADDYFYKQLKSFVTHHKLDDSVTFYGAARDHTLIELYTHAQALVFPSLMEGFGLPALEALSLGCPVIASNISVFHEILGEYGLYFDPKDSNALSLMLGSIAQKRPIIEQRSITKHLSGFSWKSLARETLDIYESSARI